MIQLTKDQEKWGFVCGRISALEARLLPYDLFQALVPLERTEDIFARLQDTFLREWMTPGGVNWTDWTASIDQYFVEQVQGLARDLPEPALGDLFLLPYDYLNLKRAVLNQPPYAFAANLFPQERLTAVASGDVALLPDELRPVVAGVVGAASGEGGAALVDMVLDGAYLRHVQAIAAQVNAPLITAALRELVLGRAVVVLWRALLAGQAIKPFERNFLPLGEWNGIISEMIAAPDVRGWGAVLPGIVGDIWREAQQSADEEQVFRFEQLLSNRVMALAQRGKLQTSGPERVFGYLWALNVEAYNLKLVISGRVNGVDPELLKRRLRVCYV